MPPTLVRCFRVLIVLVFQFVYNSVHSRDRSDIVNQGLIGALAPKLG